jgi:hypothetical protein
MLPLFRRVTLGVGVAVAVSLVTLSAQGTNPLVGTWKLNVAASTYSPGPPPKSSTRTVEDWGGGLFLSTSNGVNDKGDPTWAHFAYRYDGKDYPYASSTSPGTSPQFTTVAFKRIDANSWETTAKVAGKVVQTQAVSVSKDGKTYTARTKGTNTQGQPVNNVVVYDRQ